MKRRCSWVSLAGIGLLLGLMMYAVLWMLCPQEFLASDPWQYSSRAFAIAHGGNFGSDQTHDLNVFNHRLAVVIPVAFFYSVFGVNIITTNLWPLCATLLLIVVVWFALPDYKSKLIGVLLCVTSLPLFKSSVALYPDIIAAAFMASSSLVLFNRKRIIEAPKIWWLAPTSSVVLLFLGFLAKESFYWVLPLWALAFFVDIRDSNRVGLLRRFYVPVFAVGLVLGMGYLVFCHLIWGDPFARFKSIQALTGHHLWSWDRASAGELLRRLTIAPVRLLLEQYGAPILLLALLGLIISPQAIRQWGYYAICCLLLFWFGSTSFTRYEPLPLVERMTLPMLPAFYILAAFASSRLFVASGRALWLNSALPIVLVLGLTGLPFAQYVKSWRTMKLPEAKAMRMVAQEIHSHPDREYLLVCSDKRSPGALAFYFSYHYPEHLHVVAAENLQEGLLSIENQFAFINSNRSQFLEVTYAERNYDKAIASLGLAPIYESDGISLFKGVQGDQLRKLISVNRKSAQQMSPGTAVLKPDLCTNHTSSVLHF